MDGDNMSERDEINTLDSVEWQRSMASYMNVFPDVLNGLADALDEVDLSRLEDKKQREIKNKINAVRQLARLPVPSAPTSDGGVARAIGKHGAELGRMNKIQFVGGKVLNNCMGIALFLDPDQLSEYMARGPVRLPPLWIVPALHEHGMDHIHDVDDPTHYHSTPERTHNGHTHTLNQTHKHTVTICGVEYPTSEDYGGSSTAYATCDAHAAVDTGAKATGLTVKTTTGEVTDGTGLTIGLVAPE